MPEDVVHKDPLEAMNTPDRALIPPPKDDRDFNMGRALAETASYDAADFVLIGCPQDIGVRRNKGRPGAHEAPEEIRRALYKFPAPDFAREGSVCDLGDVNLHKTLEGTHARLRRIVRQALSDGKRVIVLGGGNDISYPDVAALDDVADNILAFNIDSHFDVRESEKRHSGTPYRQLLEQEYLHPPHFFEMAGKTIANAPEYESYLREKGVNIVPLEELRERGMTAVFEKILADFSGDAVFWGFDIDAVRANDAPGVSASYPVGLTAEEICQLAALAGKDQRSRVVELSEVNPSYDVDGRTAKLGAMMILYYLQEASVHCRGE